MGDGSIIEGAARPVREIAADLADAWLGFIGDDRCTWNIGVLCYAETVNSLLVTEDGAQVLASDLIRYLLMALPRVFVLPVERQAKAKALRAELRAMVGGSV